MNYTVIKDLNLLNQFINFLPELKQNETYYLSLLARNKYAPVLKSDKAQLKRFTANKKNMLSKIQQLECKLGAYQKDNILIPQEALALYINPNPRCMETATKNSLIKFANLITHPYNGYNPHQEVLSEIQKACSRKVFIDFDFDKVELQPTLQAIAPFINRNAIHIVQTKNGFHLLVETAKIEKQFVKIWHQTISSQAGCDVKGDNLIPVVGCIQGNFCPQFVV
jgi:hypothetical protein